MTSSVFKNRSEKMRTQCYLKESTGDKEWITLTKSLITNLESGNLLEIEYPFH